MESNEGNATNVGTPYKEIKEGESFSTATAIAVARQDDLANYAFVVQNYSEVKKVTNGLDLVMRFDLVVNDKKQGLLVVKRRAEYDDVGYFCNVIEVGISLIEMQSGMVLDLGDRERWAPILLEIVAAAQAHEAEGNDRTHVWFKENLRQFGKFWRGKAAIGIDGDVEHFKDMLEALGRSAYGPAKFFQGVDNWYQSKEIKFAMGARTSAQWESIEELGLSADAGLHRRHHGLRRGSIQ